MENKYVLSETQIASTDTNVWSWSNIIAIIALIGTIATTISTMVGAVRPSWGAALATIGSIILGVTGRVQGTPIK